MAHADMSSESMRTCKKCGLRVKWGDIRKHHIDVHGLVVAGGAARKGYNKTMTPPVQPLDALGTFQKARADMKEAMLKIDDERAQLMNRLRDLDDLAAKMKPLL